MKYYFELPVSLEREFGSEYKFLFPKFGAYADTKEEAEQEVKNWIKEYLKKEKLNHPVETGESPF
jgi:hypothetical protein